jgi:hypothetical protein
MVSDGDAQGSKHQDIRECREFSEEDLRAGGIPNATKPGNPPQPQGQRKKMPREHISIRMMKGQVIYDAVG